ncbi:hypothetical protein HPB50_025161 [Hyalomma asiaticum]|uniref:Uncharacterized protein n=1 Tax=Hyalomma asiaticum TaxID=266040 RepID=A0ACB7TR91_HYAAI|nr:hypothetical protein HPB50_025161 [Hyalomma asiaticum]
MIVRQNQGSCVSMWMLRSRDAGVVEKVVTEYKDGDVGRLDSATLVVHVYEVNDDVGLEELEDGMAAASHWVLPSAHLEGLWESLIYESPIKDESGKLVMKLFQKIESLIDDGSTLVFVLIDEVESLAHCRSTAIGGNEPSDAIRVVNALLTQIDTMKRYPNVFVLTTSNISGVIDVAFVDRADFKYHLGYPSQKCISKIIMSCMKELYRVSVINENLSFLESNADDRGEELKSLYNSLCHRAVGLSGRRLRKLPFIAHSICTVDGSLTLKTFLLALSEAVDRQLQENKEITTSMEVR